MQTQLQQTPTESVNESPCVNFGLISSPLSLRNPSTFLDHILIEHFIYIYTYIYICICMFICCQTFVL